MPLPASADGRDGAGAAGRCCVVAGAAREGGGAFAGRVASRGDAGTERATGAGLGVGCGSVIGGGAGTERATGAGDRTAGRAEAGAGRPPVNPVLSTKQGMALRSIYGPQAYYLGPLRGQTFTARTSPHVDDRTQQVRRQSWEHRSRTSAACRLAGEASPKIVEDVLQPSALVPCGCARSRQAGMGTVVHVLRKQSIREEKEPRDRVLVEHGESTRSVRIRHVDRQRRVVRR